MAKKKNLVDVVEVKKEAIQLKQQKKRVDDKEKAALELQKKTILEEWQKNMDAIIQAIFLEMPDKKREILELLSKNKFSKYKPDLSFEENFKNPLFRAAFRNKVKELFAIRFEALDRKYKLELSKSQKAIDELQ